MIRKIVFFFQSIISELPNGAQVGQTVTISGSHFFINKESSQWNKIDVFLDYIK